MVLRAKLSLSLPPPHQPFQECRKRPITLGKNRLLPLPAFPNGLLTRSPTLVRTTPIHFQSPIGSLAYPSGPVLRRTSRGSHETGVARLSGNRHRPNQISAPIRLTRSRELSRILVVESMPGINGLLAVNANTAKQGQDISSAPKKDLQLRGDRHPGKAQLQEANKQVGAAAEVSLLRGAHVHSPVQGPHQLSPKSSQPFIRDVVSFGYKTEQGVTDRVTVFGNGVAGAPYEHPPVVRRGGDAHGRA